MNTQLTPLKDKEEIEIKKKKILFICTGNTCRSPMCAALYNSKYRNSNEYAFSAGLYADGSPISEKAVAALEKNGIYSTHENNYQNHVSHTVTEEDIESAESIICVSASHMLSLVIDYPGYISKISVLFPSIRDPYGGTLSDYEKCLSDIDSALYNIKNGESQ